MLSCYSFEHELLFLQSRALQESNDGLIHERMAALAMKDLFFNAFFLSREQHKPFGRTDVSWNPDGSVLALGNEDG